MLGAHVSIRPVTRWRFVLLPWLLLMAWTSAIYLRAALEPPPGRVFVGTFHWIDDVYTYVSFAQQAEDGALLFRNKLVDATRARADIVNLEWWLVGRVSLALGRRPFLAYRLLSAVATLALLAGVARWLAAVGVKDSHRPAALALVFLGGGLGGLLFGLTDLPAWRCLDLATGAFPFLEVLANPHWVAASALLVWALWGFAAIPAPRGPLLGAGLGTVLGLVRPYDAALLFGIEGFAVVLTSPAREWPRRLMPVVPVGLVLGYNAWLLFSSPDAQRHMASFGSVVPSPVELLPALGPAVLLALTAWRQRDGEGAGYRLRLALWAALALALVVLRPLSVSLQFVVGVGLPLLVLGAAGLSRLRARWTALAALCLSTSTLVATRIVLADDPNWFVPRERLAAALALRGQCRPGDRVLAPPDIGLYVHGLTACDAFVAHEAAPDYAERLAETRAFYAEAPPAARAEMLDRHGLTRLVLPGYAGPRPSGWLGGDTTFQAVAQVGQGPGLITIYARPRAEAPARGPARDERLR
jgi:hypothetical protein